MIIYDKPGTFNFLTRSIILIISTGLAYYVAFETNIVSFILRDLPEDDIYQYSLTIIVFGIIFGIGRFIILTHDKRKEFKNAFQQQNETLFSNALQLLFKENDKIANGVGLRDLVKLKQTGAIDGKRVDMITSGGLKLNNVFLSDANLHGVNLKNADLSSADLSRANFEHTNLSDTNINSANLHGANFEHINLRNAVYNDETLASIEDITARKKLEDEGKKNVV